jgi:hypothetical protein
MTHGQFVASVLAIHAAVFVVAIAAFYKYGDRTDIFNKSLQETTKTAERIRRKITEALAELLEPVFENPGTVPTPILSPDGETYIEKAINPVRSELFRETLQSFVEEKSEAIADLRSLLAAKGCWCFWAKFLSWSLFVLVVWQITATGGTALLETVLRLQLPDLILYVSLVPTVLLVITSLSPFPFMLKHHDVIMKSRERYDQL